MSILIKGGKMPKNCDKCFLSSSMGLRCDAANKSLATDTYPKRPSWCPLVEVPEPHGRLIDADELEAILSGLGDRAYRRTKGTIMDAQKFLNNAPTLIEAEEQDHECG